MVNNFDKIRQLIKFPNPTSFYFLEIIKRRKENPEMTKHASVVRDFYIYSVKEFDELEGKIKELCDTHNARAYFRLNLRDSKKIALQCLKRLSELMITEDYKAVSKMYAHVTGEFHSDPDKTWVIDIDKPENYDKQAFQFMINRIEVAIEKLEGKILAQLPTKNGVHLITNPFRLDVFKGEFPDVDVHKDSPTILYCP